MKNINISIAGLGNVGSALIELIEKNANLIKYKANLDINILGLSAKNKNKKRIFDINSYKWFENSHDLLKVDGVEPDILIELIGLEDGISFELVKSALEKKN